MADVQESTEREPYEVEFVYTVKVWATSPEEAREIVTLFGRDEAGLGEAFEQLVALDDNVTLIDPNEAEALPFDFINDQYERI